MKKTTIMLGLLFILCMMPMAFAEDEISAVTITLPSATASYVGGTYAFTGTYVGNSSGNISIYYNGTFACADTTVTTVNSTWTCSLDTSGITDGLYPNFNATAYNTSGDVTASSSVWTINFDNTDPVISAFTFDKTFVDKRKSIDYTVTATDTQDSSLTYSVVLTKPITDGTVTKTTSTGTFEQSDIDKKGTYTAVVTVTDDAGNTDTETATFTAKEDDDGELIVAVAQAQNKKDANVIIIVLSVVALFILAIVGFNILGNKKAKRKGKRR